VDVEVAAHNWTNLELADDSLSASMMKLIGDFVTPRTGAELVGSWASDLRELSDRGEYFFSYNAFSFAARKPTSADS
jgi:hypothetical protein